MQNQDTYVSAGRTSQLVTRIEGKISRESDTDVTRQYPASKPGPPEYLNLS